MGRFEAELGVERVEGEARVGVVVFVGVETTCMARETSKRAKREARSEILYSRVVPHHSTDKTS